MWGVMWIHQVVNWSKAILGVDNCKIIYVMLRIDQISTFDRTQLSIS